MTKLYEITSELKSLLDQDLSPEYIADTLEAMEGEFKEKALSMIKFTKVLESDCGAIDCEIKRLQARKKAINNRAEQIRHYLTENMAASGIKKIECPLFAITYLDPKPIVIINNSDEIPDDYVRVNTSIEPDKKAILAALKDGEEIPGVSLGSGEAGLLIK